MSNLTHYLEFTVLPNSEISQSILMNQLFDRVHLAIVASGTSIGLSFPGYQAGQEGRIGLGCCLRAFGCEHALLRFREHLMVRALDGYLTVSETKAVPGNCRHISFMRRQSKGWPSARSRFARRNTLDRSMKDSIYLTGVKRTIDGLPYVRYFSRSTQNHMMLFIARGLPQDQAVEGTFTRFGLSRGGATVPEFD